jgi:hypothetical protein
VYKANDPTSSKSRKGTAGEVEARLPTAPVVPNTLSPLGQFIGFYLGDGYLIDTTIGFHLKKERKINYIKGVLDQLGWKYSCNKYKDGTFRLRVYLNSHIPLILETCGAGTAAKRIGKWDMEHYVGIFDGLKNSDGSVKRNTWVYCTISDNLRKDILDFAPLAGVTCMENSKQGTCYKIMVITNNTARINDSRTPASKVSITGVSGEMFYCATMPSGGLVVRREGKVLVSGNSSPFEHQATPMKEQYCEYCEDCIDDIEINLSYVVESWEEGITHSDRAGNLWSGNFKGWVQYRQLIPNNACWEYEK